CEHLHLWQAASCLARPSDYGIPSRWRSGTGMIATICLIGTDRANPGACGKPARWTAITSPSALKSGLPDDPPIVMPSNWMTSSVAREMMPADIDVRTTDERSRANPEPAG